MCAEEGLIVMRKFLSSNCSYLCISILCTVLQALSDICRRSSVAAFTGQICSHDGHSTHSITRRKNNLAVSSRRYKNISRDPIERRDHWEAHGQ